MAEKNISRSDVDTIISSKGIFADFQERMVHWMSENYSRILDLFRRFDADNSGKLSYEEFRAGMQDLGAPATEVEIYIIAMSLDSDGDQQIDFSEFKKLRRKFKQASNTYHRGTDYPSLEVESPDQLQPCPKCNLGLWEPTPEEVTGYVLLNLRSVGFQNVLNFPGHITVQVPSSISIYGIAQIVKRELGPCTLNVRIFQATGSDTKDEMAFDKKLHEYGITGTLPPEEPDKVTLLYDFDYPLLDCPLLMANFSV